MFKKLNLSRTLQYLTVSSLLIFVLVLFAIPVLAATYTGTIDGSQTMDIDPACGVTNQPYTFHGTLMVDTTADYDYRDTSFIGGGYDSQMLLYTTLLDPANSSVNLYAQIDDSGLVSLTANVTYYMYIIPYCSQGPGNYNFEFTGPGAFAIGDESLPVASSDEATDIVFPPDDRINWQYGDGSTAVFAHESGNGVVAYCHSDGAVWAGMYINQATVDNAGETSQDVPVVDYNDNGCHVAFYILDNGQYQINIWTWNGKLYEMLADNINFTNATMRSFE